MEIVPIILSGGSGERLWPLSRQQYPKQYISLIDDETMFQKTLLRLNGLENISTPIIVCNESHRFLVAEQCLQINVLKPHILLEPAGRNTAPAIAAAAIHALNLFKDPILLVMSADHVIEDNKAFIEVIKIAKKHANQDKLLTFGVVPTEAKVDYGYIKAIEKDNKDIFKVIEFIEKPKLKSAKSYLNQGKYLWNSGIFMFKAEQILNELKIYSPDVYSAAFLSIQNASKDLDFTRLERKAFESAPHISIDYSLMEKSKKIFVVPMDVGWNDVGTWPSLYDIGNKDKNGNVIHGDVIIQDTTNSLINSKKNHLVATIGVDNLVIVKTNDVTFISTKEKTRQVKSIVTEMQTRNRKEVFENRKVYRPWGWYDLLEKGLNFQVKRLVVNSGSRLSLQMHRKRAEHWVVVNGIATVRKGEKILTLDRGDSIYIPIATKHSLENKTKELLEIIEVQSGTYLGEDDIERFEDIYGRIDSKC